VADFVDGRRGEEDVDVLLARGVAEEVDLLLPDDCPEDEVAEAGVYADFPNVGPLYLVNGAREGDPVLASGLEIGVHALLCG
jgi:hypothetical protein